MTRREEDFDMTQEKSPESICLTPLEKHKGQLKRSDHIQGFQHGSPLPIRSDGGDLRRKAARCPQEVPALGS
ncbi:hypothetical protein Y1Q_0023295 [Alligator mississippiensis]|uniref:Uncharacterized protein n=1 Tax=Alligator mississippiensis TaxID=8496 RepID=A0A151MTY3_ALLMI|nr:hypothetical protein Y1Q_0023295 [Alligator mississippiensis]